MRLPHAPTAQAPSSPPSPASRRRCPRAVSRSWASRWTLSTVSHAAREPACTHSRARRRSASCYSSTPAAPTRDRTATARTQIPIAYGVIGAGARCEVIMYTEGTHEATFRYIQSAKIDAVLLRIAPDAMPSTSADGLNNRLCELAAYGGVAVFPHPDLGAAMAANSAMAVLADATRPRVFPHLDVCEATGLAPERAFRQPDRRPFGVPPMPPLPKPKTGQKAPEPILPSIHNRPLAGKGCGGRAVPLVGDQDGLLGTTLPDSRVFVGGDEERVYSSKLDVAREFKVPCILATCE